MATAGRRRRTTARRGEYRVPVSTSRLRCRRLRSRLPAGRLLGGMALAAALACSPATALADGFEGFGREGFEDGEGEGALAALAMAALLANAAYIPYKWLRAAVPALNVTWASRAHCAAGIAACLFGTVHALSVDRGNPLLWLGLAIMGYEVVGGLVLRSRAASRPVRRTASLLHAQRVGFYAMLGALLLGHALVDD